MVEIVIKLCTPYRLSSAGSVSQCKASLSAAAAGGSSYELRQGWDVLSNLGHLWTWAGGEAEAQYIYPKEGKVYGF